MVVVAIIGILAATAIPGYTRARNLALKNACIHNLNQIQGAIQIWALNTGAGGNAVPTIDELSPDYIKKWPLCGGSSYASTAVDEMPVCSNIASYPDHHL
jgi:type II secretory pathway pseudopilin PulG